MDEFLQEPYGALQNVQSVLGLCVHDVELVPE